jgi:hypothetical protein
LTGLSPRQVMTRLPVEVWFRENPRSFDVKLEENIRQVMPSQTLLLLDKCFYHFSFWLKLSEAEIT